MYFNRKNAEQKNWRMIKKGKHFLFGCSLVFAIGAALVAPSVKADTVEANPEAGSTTEGIKPAAAEEDVTYAAPAVEVAPSTLAAPATVVTEEKAEKPVATTENSKEEAVATTTVSVDKSQLEAVLAQAKAKSLEGQEASVKAEVAVAIAEAEALVANGSASQEKVNQSVERLTQAVASIKEVTEVAAETRTEETTESSATPKVRSRRATTEGTARSIDEKRLDRVTVTKDNFDSYFKEGGSASYDETSGIIRLTEDTNSQAGNAYLRFKIDPKEDFTFTGKVDVGDKYEGHGEGGDGVGFVFHTGEVSKLGQTGASVGMGQIPAAFGFKLDTYHNTNNPNAAQNSIADPKYGGLAYKRNAFGAFYSSNNAGKVNTIGDVKALSPGPSGQLVDFKISYIGRTKDFTVTYGGQTWSTNLETARAGNNTAVITSDAKTALNKTNATYALSFVASTGGATNLQRVQIEKFEFTAPQIVQVAFYDEAGNELAASSAIPGDRDQVVNLNNIEAVQKAISKIKAKGYTLKEVNKQKAETYNAAANTVTLRQGGQLLKYIFAVPSPEVTKTLPSDNGMLPNGAIKSTDRTLSGTGTPGATINIKVAGNTVVDNVTVESNGKWTATLPTGLNSNVTTQDQLVPKNSLVVTQKIGPSESEEAAVDVALGESSVVPSTESKDQQSIVAETTTVTLKVPHDAGITYFDYPKAGNARSEVAIKRDSIPGAWTSKDESKAVVKSYSSDGFVDTIMLEMKEQIQAGKAKVISNIKENKYSSPTGWKEINVEAKPDTTPPTAPNVNTVKAGATSITGTAEANSTVEAILPNGRKVTATAGTDGSFTIPVSGLNEGDTISVTATDAANNKSTPSVVTVKENVRPVVNIPYDDKGNQIIYVYSGEENNIELKITDNSGKIAKAYLVFAQDNRTGLGTEDTGYLNGKTKNALYLKANRFGSETTATVANPAIIKLTANIPNGSYTDGTGITRYIYAEDLAGNTNYDNAGAAWDTGAPGRIRFVWKPQSFKYNAVAPSTPLTSNTVPEASAIEKAVKDANPTFSDKIGSVTLDGTNVKVTYKDGSTDLLPANSVFTIEPTAPTVTPVKNTSALTTPEKQAVEAAVRTKNPDATTVVVGNDGSTTLTYSNGSTAKLTPSQTVKAADANGVQAPAAKTPVQNTSALTQPEKDAVKKAVADANPSATKVEVGNDGSATVTFPDGSTATLPGAKTVKEADSKGVQEPAAKTPVQNTSALTQPEKDAVKKAVADANPSATKVEVGNDGSATVTFPDGSTATLPGAKTVKEADSKGVQEPAAKTPVQNTSALTQPEKDAVKKAVADANPTATKVEVGDNGDTTVTFPDGTTATLPGDQTVKEADSKGVQAPSTKTPVKDTSALTDDEKATVKKAIEGANPSATKVEVGNDGSATVTFPDGSTATLTGDQTVKEADSKGLKAPATKTPVKDTSALTDDEKTTVKKAVEGANPSATKVEVGNDGSATVTFPDGSTATLTGDQTVKEADSKGVQAPSTKTPVKDTSALTQPEKDAVKKAIEGANPSATKVEVGNDGSATVTFPDGSTATLTGDQTVKEADSKGVQAPSTKTPVKDTSALTDEEKTQVAEEILKANPTLEDVDVANDGTATVLFPDGSTATLTPAQTVVKAEEKAKDADGLKAPATKTPVKDTSALTDDEKATVKKAVEGANPSATKVEVGNDGSATVTFPDGSTATLTGDQTVKEADSKGLKAPATKTPVKDTSALTDDEKTTVKKAVEGANPSATKVEVGNDGSATVTFPDGSTATLTGDQTVKEADSKGLKAPATKTPVKDTSALTDDEKTTVKKAVEGANPSATKVEVGNDGSATVTFPDGSTATLTGDQTVKEADSKGVQAPSTKTPVKDTSALTQPEKDAVKKAIEGANPSATKVEVGNDGSATVTFPDGSTATLTGAKTVKEADSKGVQEPAAKTPVQNTSALTQPEKDAVKKAVADTNPTATKVEVGNDGSATVTFPDGTTATLTGDKTVKEADSKGVKAPATKTPVQNTSSLTQPEKDAVKKAVSTANPSATKVEVGNDGSATVTFPDGTTATLTGDKTVKEADSKGVKAPATKTPVQNTSSLTQPEKDAVKKAVSTANPSATKVEVGNDGSATVTFPDGTTATLTGDKTVKEADSKGVKAPTTKTPVQNTSSLTQPEKDAVKKAVADANPTATKVEVGNDGSATVTFPDGTTATLTGDKTVKEADSKGVKAPTTKTPVQNTSSLTQPEKDAVKKAVEGANPTATKVEVGNDGSATVTFPDGTTATLTGDKTVKEADSKGVKEPAAKTPVQNTSSLTQPEKDAVKKAVADANPTATKVEVGNDGSATVTFPDGSTATLTPAQTVVKAEDKEAPTAPVVNPVKAGDTAVTGTAEAGSTVEVTLPDGTKVSAKADKDGNYSVPVSGLKEGDKVSVTATDEAGNKSGATDATVAKADDKTAPDAPKVNEVKAGDTAVTGTAEAGSTVEVTLPNGTKATATAGEDGTFSVPVSGLNEGDKVSVTATDAAGNKSGATDATVAKADDKEAPTAPVVNPVKAGDTAVTGTAEAGSTVEVTLPNGTKATATAGEDGTFSVPVSGLNEGDKVSVTATDAAGNKSGATDATVAKADDKEAPTAPVVNPVKAGDTAVTGTAEARSTVEVTLPDGTKVSAKADKDGNYSVPVSGLKEGDKVSVTATDEAGNKSGATDATVAKADDKTAPDAPKVNEVKAGDTAVTGTAEAGSTVEVTLPNGTKATATAGEDGTFSVPVSGLNEGDKVSVTATDAAGNKSGATDATVAKAGNKSGATDATVAKADDKEAPTAPVVNPVKAGDTAVTGTAEAGSTVEVTLPDGTKVSAKADKDGNYSVPVSGLKEGDKVSVTATDEAGNKSGATEATVAKADDKEAPTAPVVNPVKAGDTAVTGTAEAGSTVEVTLPDGTKVSAKADKDGNYSVPVSGLKEGDKVSVTATDEAGNKSGATDATVAKADDKTAPDAPKVNEVKAGDTAVTGTAEAGSTVEVTLPNGTKATATAGEDGTFSVPVSGLNEGDKVSVTATDAAGNKSGATDATVAKADDKEAPTAPVVNPVKAGDTAVTGTAEAGSTVEVTLPDGTKVSAKADKDGNYSVPVSGLKEGDKVSVTATDAAGNKSGATEATVAKADDKEAPTAPVVNPVKAGDTAVTGTAEAGSTVEVTLPDGTKVSAKADKDGNYSVPVSGLKEGDKVSVTATDEAGNKSGATDATVAKADDKTAPDAPKVNEVKAGDTAVTGTAEAGSTVEVTLPNGTKATATAGEDGTFSVPVSGLKEGDKVSVTATDAAGNKSGATEATVAKADDKEAPAAPVVNDVKEGDKAVTGTAEVGSIIEITLPNSETVTVRADEAGHFSLPVVGLKAGDKVTAVAKDASGNTSTPTEKTVGKRDVKDADGIQAPSTKTPVKDTANLTDAEKAKVKEAVEAANPGSKAEVGQDGITTVTFPDGSTATLTGDQTVKTADSNGVQAPSAKTPVKDTANLTDAEKAKVKEAVEAANPGSKAEVGQDGTTTVTFPDGSTATLTGDQTVKTADSNGVQAPSAKTPVKDTANLTDAEKAKVKEAVEAANPGSKAEVGQDGTTTVTFPDGSTATLTGDQTVKTADSNGVQAPSAKTPVKDTANLTDAEKAKVKEAVEAANPGSKAEVGQDGTTTVTFPDGSTATLTGDKTVTRADITAPNVPVVNPVKAGDKAITGTAEAGSTVEVTLPDGTKVSAKADKDGNYSVPVSGLEEGKTVSVTSTDDAGNTSDATTATVAKADDKTAPNAPVVNPVKAGDTAVTGTAEAGSTVEVTLPDGTKVSAKADKDGNYSVPVNGLNAGDTVSVTATDEAGNKSDATTATVAKADDKADDKTAPTAPVVNPVKAGDTAITGTAEAGSTVEVTLPDGTKVSAKADKDGKFSIPVNGLNAGDTVSVTATDESGNTSATTTVTVSNVNVGGKEADNAKVPALTPVVDPNNLTDAEKAKVAEEVKKANPTATDVKVKNDGSVVVTFADGSVATIAANKVVKEATKESSAQAPAKKAGAKELPNTGTKQSNASLGLALLAAVTGGLLVSKKRKEEE